MALLPFTIQAVIMMVSGNLGAGVWKDSNCKRIVMMKRIRRDNMRRNWKQMMAVCMAGGLLATQLVGCGAKESPTAGGSPSASEQTQPDAAETTAGTEEKAMEQRVQLGEGGTKELTWQAEDLDAEWDAQTATGIVCSDSEIVVEGEGASVSDQTVTIDRAGTYVVSGTMMDGQILIDTEKDETVHLVLNGAELSNMTTAPVYSKGKGKIILTIADGSTNTISDSSQYQYDSETEDEPDAPVFVTGDLTINGSGTLEVYGNYQCGIRSKHDLKVVSGTITIHAESDGLKGRDSVAIRDGALVITSGKDGIKSNNDEDRAKGYIWVDGGTITIAAGDDGIQAETHVIINEGEIHITESEEGIAGLTVDILGGVVDVVSSDDGINSAATVETEQEKAADQEGVYTRIAGGEVRINAMADGIDSNGDFYMEGGTLYLSGPSGDGDGILDYNGSGIITGGTLFGAGSSGMIPTFDETASTQNFLVVYFTETQKAGTTIVLKDDSQNELGRLVTEKEYSAAIISTPDIRSGITYSVSVGDETVDLQVEGRMTVYGTASGRGKGRPEGGFGGSREGGPKGAPEGAPQGEPGNRPNAEPGSRPEGAAGSDSEDKADLGNELPPDETRSERGWFKG